MMAIKTILATVLDKATDDDNYYAAASGNNEHADNTLMMMVVEVVLSIVTHAAAQAQARRQDRDETTSTSHSPFRLLTLGFLAELCQGLRCRRAAQRATDSRRSKCGTAGACEDIDSARGAMPRGQGIARHMACPGGVGYFEQAHGSIAEAACLDSRVLGGGAAPHA